VTRRFQHIWLALVSMRKERAIQLVLVLLVAFGSLTAVARTPALRAYDLRISRWVQSHRSPLADEIALFFTACGNAEVLALVTFLTVGALGAAGMRRGAGLALLVLLWMPIDAIAKLLIARPRPLPLEVLILLPAPGMSFPSGHAMGTAVTYGFVALLVWLHGGRRARRLAGVVPLCALIAATGWSRIYLGAHWLSDVLGGWSVALALILLLARLYGRGALQEAQAAPRTASRLDRRSA
jgi:membrane-associated phospholipid phosphatase